MASTRADAIRVVAKGILDKPIKKQLLDRSSQLIQKYKRKFPKDDVGDKYMNYVGPVNKQTLLDAFKEGLALMMQNDNWHPANNLEKREQKNLNHFEQNVLPAYLKLLDGELVTIYRGVRTTKAGIKYVVRNMLHRNSWSLSPFAAYAYAKIPDTKNPYRYILRMKCGLTKTNLMLSAFTEGLWSEFGSLDKGANDEVILNKDFKKMKPEFYPLTDESKKVLEDMGLTKYIINDIPELAQLKR